MKFRSTAIGRFILPLLYNCVFSSIRKTAEVVTVFKNNSKLDHSKLDYSNYRPISLFSNIEKILEKLMYKRMYTFLSNNDVIYIWQLDSDNSILHLMS